MNDTVKQLIQKIAKEGRTAPVLIAKVVSVDETKRTCEVEPINKDANVTDVRLSASISSSKGFCCIPKVDSFVIIIFFDKDVAFVAMFTEVDKILIDTPEVIFNGGNLDGMVKINSLIEKINRLENTFNSHIHQVVGVTAGGATAPSSPTVSQIIPITTKTDLENKKIKQ